MLSRMEPSHVFPFSHGHGCISGQTGSHGRKPPNATAMGIQRVLGVTMEYVYNHSQLMRSRALRTRTCRQTTSPNQSSRTWTRASSSTRRRTTIGSWRTATNNTTTYAREVRMSRQWSTMIDNVTNMIDNVTTMIDSVTTIIDNVTTMTDNLTTMIDNDWQCHEYDW